MGIFPQSIGTYLIRKNGNHAISLVILVTNNHTQRTILEKKGATYGWLR